MNIGSLLVSLMLGGAVASAATITWDGGGGNSSWHTPANWSGDVLPGAADDVVITGSGEVVYSSGSSTVRSIQSSRGLTISGGTLTLRAGASVISGSFVTVSV